MNSKKIVRTALATALALPLAALAAPTAINVDGLFNLGNNANIFNSTTVSHATVQGTIVNNAIGWYSFTGVAGATVFFDHDDATGGTLLDSTLALFRSNGELLAFDDDTTPDSGSSSGLNAFLGQYTLDANDTYYVGIAAFAVFPDVTGCNFSSLTRPDGDPGGFMATGCTNRSFSFSGTPFYQGSYTLHISNSVPGNTVPEPMSLALSGLALLAAGAASRRR